jgi:biopolymer transport protein ExbB
MILKKKLKILAVIALAMVQSLAAQDALASVAFDAQAKLDDALKRLATQREVTAREKIPLSTQRDTLFSKLRETRREADRAQRVSDNQSADLTAFEANLKAQAEVVDYVINLSSEFGRTLGAQLDASEVAFYSDLIAAGEAAAEDPYATPLDKLQPQKAVLEAGLSRMEGLVGGAIFEGKAILPSGVFEEGSFIRFGPVTMFASKSGAAGLVELGASLDPIVRTIAEGTYDAGILALAEGKVGEIPLDSTLDNALAIAATKESLLDHIKKGGIWVYPILSFAALSLLVGVFKAFEIYTLPKPKPGALASILSNLANGKKAAAVATAKAMPGPVGHMLQQGVRYSDHDPELVEEILYESVVETQPKVMRLLAFISVTAAVAPLLGLLGTVTGMINTFNRIKIFGTGDAKSLSGGISEALITTEFGLIVAIPSLLIYAILSRQAKGYLSRMEKMSISFINGLKTFKGPKPLEAEGEPVLATK